LQARGKFTKRLGQDKEERAPTAVNVVRDVVSPEGKSEVVEKRGVSVKSEKEGQCVYRWCRPDGECGGGSRQGAEGSKSVPLHQLGVII